MIGVGCRCGSDIIGFTARTMEERIMRKLSMQTLPRSVIKLTVALRSIMLVALEPVDYVSKLINGEKELPPLYLRRYVGPLMSFRTSGAEFTAYLKLIGHLLPNERVLDIGCGCGLMALNLAEYLDTQGKYIGVDIHKGSIRWCQQKISRKHPNFTFAHIDVQNRVYNPNGKWPAEHYIFPFESKSFDIILLKSVFTHMRPDEVDNYLKEISRLLSDKGRCLATFFLLNQEQEELSKHGSSHLNFKFGDENWRYMYKNRPEAGVAYREDYVLELLSKNGLVLGEPIKYGTWSGRSAGLSYQDLLLIHKTEFATQVAE